eukprot:9457165-Alexandrium_andersonii.AAC.1
MPSASPGDQQEGGGTAPRAPDSGRVCPRGPGRRPRPPPSPARGPAEEEERATHGSNCRTEGEAQSGGLHST